MTEMYELQTTYMVEFFYHDLYHGTQEWRVWGDNMDKNTMLKACVWMLEDSNIKVLKVTNNSTKQRMEIS